LRSIPFPVWEDCTLHLAKQLTNAFPHEYVAIAQQPCNACPMRSFLGIVIGLFGLIVCAIPVSMLLWASQQVRFGLSNSGTWTLAAI
jgi:hypothetical protein